MQVRKKIMDNKTDFVAKTEKQLAELNRKIDALQARIATAPRELKAKYDESSQELQKKRQAVVEKLATLNKASGEAWKDLKLGLETAWNDLNSTWNKMKSRYHPQE